MGAAKRFVCGKSFRGPTGWLLCDLHPGHEGWCADHEHKYQPAGDPHTGEKWQACVICSERAS